MNIIGSVANAFRRFGPLGAFALLVAASAVVPGAAEARDRPGTPNQQQLVLCGTPGPSFRPVLCGKFYDTATESVHVEVESTRNGAPYALNGAAFACGPNVAVAFAGVACYTATSVLTQKHLYGFATGPLDFGAQYCVRFRARRTSDSVVSDVWSNYACAQTPPVPAKPAAFDVVVSFGSYPPGSGLNGRPGSIGVSWGRNSPGAVSYVVSFYEALGSTPLYTAPPVEASGQSILVTWQLPPTLNAIRVMTCAYNFSGQQCATGSYNVVPSSASSSVYQTPRKSTTRNIPPASSGSIMAGVDMPGNDYRNQPISGTAVDCQNMCTADGRCVAWTWVKPGVQNAQAVCWLKSGVPAQRPNPNTTSGIKAGAVH